MIMMIIIILNRPLCYVLYWRTVWSLDVWELNTTAALLSMQWQCVRLCKCDIANLQLSGAQQQCMRRKQENTDVCSLRGLNTHICKCSIRSAQNLRVISHFSLQHQIGRHTGRGESVWGHKPLCVLLTTITEHAVDMKCLQLLRDTLQVASGDP